MFLVNVRAIRHCVAFHSLRSIHVSAVGYGGPVSACFRGVGLNQLHGARRSLININNKMQSYCPPTRCLSASSHSEDGDLIYKGNLSLAIRGVKAFSYLTSGISIILVPQILLKTGLGVESVALQAAFCGVLAFFTFITPVMLHLLSKGYVVRLYHNPDKDTYTAITYSVFMTEKRTVFHQKQVRIPKVTQMFTTFHVNKVGLLVDPDMFAIPHDYNHLMGYDKPFSFDIEMD